MGGAVRPTGTARWVEMVLAAYRGGEAGPADTFFVGRIPEEGTGGLDLRDPRNRNLVLPPATDDMSLDRLRGRARGLDGADGVCEHGDSGRSPTAGSR